MVRVRTDNGDIIVERGLAVPAPAMPAGFKTRLLAGHILCFPGLGFGGEYHRRLLDPLPHVEFVLLENAGHSTWIDAPAAHRRALLRALER